MYCLYGNKINWSGTNLKERNAVFLQLASNIVEGNISERNKKGQIRNWVLVVYESPNKICPNNVSCKLSSQAAYLEF